MHPIWFRPPDFAVFAVRFSASAAVYWKEYRLCVCFTSWYIRKFIRAITLVSVQNIIRQESGRVLQTLKTTPHRHDRTSTAMFNGFMTLTCKSPLNVLIVLYRCLYVFLSVCHNYIDVFFSLFVCIYLFLFPSWLLVFHYYHCLLLARAKSWAVIPSAAVPPDFCLCNS